MQVDFVSVACTSTIDEQPFIGWRAPYIFWRAVAPDKSKGKLSRSNMVRCTPLVPSKLSPGEAGDLTPRVPTAALLLSFSFPSSSLSTLPFRPFFLLHPMHNLTILEA